MKISLPNDAEATGYRETRPYHYEQVFTSATHNFTGTALEMARAGIAYAYEDMGAHRRRAIDITMLPK